jgi:dipeptidyl aminopeptidase/acylaminoacyl peptidase
LSAQNSALLIAFSKARLPTRMPVTPSDLDGENTLSEAWEEKATATESEKLIPLVKNIAPRANWTGRGDEFWIADQSATGFEYRLVDAETGEQRPAFDHEALAALLSDAGEADFEPGALAITRLDFADDALTVHTALGVYRCNPDLTECESIDTGTALPTTARAPSGSSEAFVRNFNIWLRDLESGEEEQLSNDGEDGFQYGNVSTTLSRVQARRNNEALPMLNLIWSPDGRHLATLREDARDQEVRSYIKEHLPPDHPFTVSHRERLLVAADRKPIHHELAIFDTETGYKTVADVDATAFQDFAPLFFASRCLWWDLHNGRLFVVGAEYGGQTYRIIEINLDSGATRTVVEESETHYYQFAARDYSKPCFFVTADGSEVIWYSQRSGSAQLYLYDVATGELKNRITDDVGVVFDLVRVDEADRMVYFTAGGREPDRDPYYAHLYRVSMDGGEVILLTPENAVHDFQTFALPFDVGVLGASGSQFSPSGVCFVDVFSTLTEPPVMVLRKSSGELIAEILRADASDLEAGGWQPPEPFVVKAADGETDLYGAMFRPSDFDPTKKYAVVDQTYPGPQIDSAPHSFMDNFAAITTNNAQATAEAGFIVVALDGRGTTKRDASFRYAFAGTEDIFGSADHRAAIENLAKEYDFIDASRVGITGASYGGYGSVRAALINPDFFKVVVSHVGPHEYMSSVRNGISTERFFGVPDSDRDYYELGSNVAIIDRLEAKLMLVYGEIDENVPLRAGITIFDALINADKDFTSYVVPNADHGGASRHPYIVKRQRRFFRDHLGGPR